MKKIAHIVMLGDSLSDRGTLSKRYILGCIPLSWVSGLEGFSPVGRFTNGYVWSDIISSMFASDFLIKQLKKKQYSNDDIADAIIAKERKIANRLQYSYNLNNDLSVDFDGRTFVRSYDESGVSSYNYAWKASTSIIRFFKRIILSNLGEKRKTLLDYDKEHHISCRQKQQTLIIEWSGANDLITVNERASEAIAQRAVAERIKNIEVLLKNGYRNFVLFNLPDLSLTPRFQNMTGRKGALERENAKHCSLYFNQILSEECARLQEKYPQCTVDVFDINTTFTDIHNNPEKYQIDAAKLRQPYRTSPDFNLKLNNTSPSRGYMFWDDLHPTADTHALLAHEFYKEYTLKYQFSEPEDERQPEKELLISAEVLENAFRMSYAQRLNKEKNSFFYRLNPSHINYQTASLDTILHHGLYAGGKRTRDVLHELQWIDNKGALNLNIPVLKQAMTNAANRGRSDEKRPDIQLDGLL